MEALTTNTVGPGYTSLDQVVVELPENSESEYKLEVRIPRAPFSCHGYGPETPVSAGTGVTRPLPRPLSIGISTNVNASVDVEHLVFCD